MGANAWGAMRWLVLLTTAATIAVNALANTARINGVTTGMVANRHDNPFTPAGYTFGIWGLIYAGLIAFSLWQAAGEGARSERAAPLRSACVFTGAANMAWLVLWHHEQFALTLGVMSLLLLALLTIRARLSATPVASRIEWWCLDAPFSLYAGWITVATLANLVVVIAAAGLLSPELAEGALPLAMLLVATSIGAVVAWRWRDALFVAPLAWAALGIASKPQQLPSMRWAAAVAFVLLSACIGVALARRRRP